MRITILLTICFNGNGSETRVGYNQNVAQFFSITVILMGKEVGILDGADLRKLLDWVTKTAPLATLDVCFIEMLGAEHFCAIVEDGGRGRSLCVILMARGTQ